MDNNDKKLHTLFERLPKQQPSPMFRTSLMAKVHAEARRKERRENILAWVSLVASLLLVIAVGAFALSMVGFSEMSLPTIDITSETIFYVKSSCFLCAIIAALLSADYAIRKHYHSQTKA